MNLSLDKKIPALLILCFVNLNIFSQFHDKKTEAAFKKACYEVAKAFAKKNIAAIDKYIDQGTGIYIITRPGALDVITNYKKIEEANTLMSHYPYKDSIKIKKHKLIYDTAPRFNCGDNKWNKNGFVADSATHYNRITDIMKMRIKYEGEQHSKEEIEKIKTLENNSQKVVFTDIHKGKGLIFYLSFIKGKWYLTLIDTVESSCAA